jgi:pyrimidine deaminase RibD-like protein
VFVKNASSVRSEHEDYYSLQTRVLSASFNATNVSRNGTRHAELVAIDDILLKQGRRPEVFQGCDLYVTCEVRCGALEMACAIYILSSPQLTLFAAFYAAVHHVRGRSLCAGSPPGLLWVPQ